MTTDMANLNNLMKQAQKMQKEMARVQEELADERVEASAGGGMVRVTMSGALEVVAVHIDPSALDPDDVELMEDMVAAAVNQALKEAQELGAAKMARVTGGMGIPGLM